MESSVDHCPCCPEKAQVIKQYEILGRVITEVECPAHGVHTVFRGKLPGYARRMIKK